MTPAGRDERRRILARNIALLEEGWRAVRALEGAGIAAVVLKGAALVDLVYAPGERAMEDLDVLVPRSELARAHAALSRAGFRPLDLGRPVGRRVRHARPYVGPNRHHVDLHTEIAYPWRWTPDHAALFARAAPIEAPDGRPGWRLADEDLLLHAALAEANDEMCGDGRRDEDIRRLTASVDIDWDALLARARRARCRVALWLALRRAREGAGAQIPPRVIRALEPGALRRRALACVMTADGPPTYRFSSHPRRLRHLLAGPALTDAPWRFAAMLAHRGGVRAADLWVVTTGGGSSRPRKPR